jgi:hypothetical protein
MWRSAILVLATAFVVAVCGTAIAAQQSASPARAPSPAAATAALGRALHQLYGRIHGYWTCPPPARLGRLDCLAEVHSGRRWHQVSASATHSNGVIWIGRVSAQTWTRQWSPYSRHFILRSAEPQVPGVVSVNGPAYDWGWLAGQAAGVKAGRTHQADAFDGNDTGLIDFFVFTCSHRRGLITCKNALGDAMRYRP